MFPRAILFLSCVLCVLALTLLINAYTKPRDSHREYRGLVGSRRNLSKRVYFTSFGMNGHKAWHMAHQFYHFHMILEWHPDSFEDANFTRAHTALMRQNEGNGYGFWIWKPYIMYEMMRRNMGRIDVGDDTQNYLLFVDTLSCVLSKERGGKQRFEEYLKLLEYGDKDILVFSSGETERERTKRVVMELFNATDKQRDSKQAVGDVILMRKSEFTMGFLQEWLRILERENYKYLDGEVSEEDPTFVRPGYDRSVFSLLLKTKAIPLRKVYWVERDETRGPRRVMFPVYCEGKFNK